LVGPWFTLWRLYSYGITDTVGLTCLALLLILALIPLKWGTGPVTDAFVRMSCTQGGKYFPINVHIEDEEALRPGRPYVLGLEPHSALPIAIPMVFATASPLLPKALRGTVHGMASSVCFAVPLVRQLWWWLGLRPVSRQLMDRLLSQGKSVILNPGGVQECCEMERTGSETVYLKKRHGFVRMAMKHGAPIVPVFAFGQSETYRWYRPHWFGLTKAIARQVGAVPMAMWGRWGTPLPLQAPVDVVIGKPIEVPQTSEPSAEEVDKYLGLFIASMEAMFEKHKDEFPGCVRKTLRVL